jgi:hypothetical protein
MSKPLVSDMPRCGQWLRRSCRSSGPGPRAGVPVLRIAQEEAIAEALGEAEAGGDNGAT